MLQFFLYKKKPRNYRRLDHLGNYSSNDQSSFIYCFPHTTCIVNDNYFITYFIDIWGHLNFETICAPIQIYELNFS